MSSSMAYFGVEMPPAQAPLSEDILEGGVVNQAPVILPAAAPLVQAAPAGGPRARAATLMREWLAPQGYPEHTITMAISFLDEDILRAQPDDIYGLEWPAGGRHGFVPPAHWRYRFRREIAHLLGWTDQQPEGHPEGFPVALNQILREEIWPNVPGGNAIPERPSQEADTEEEEPDTP